MFSLGYDEGRSWLARPCFAEAGLLTEMFDVFHELEVRIELRGRLAPVLLRAALVPLFRLC
jgi:hypothetical protein